MVRRVKQVLVVVLPVDIRDLSGQFVEFAQRHDLAVDFGKALAVGVHFAGDEHVAVVHFGDHLDDCLLTAGAHIGSVCTGAQRQTDGTDDDRFAGTGLTGDDVQPVMKIDLDGVYGRIVFDQYVGYHCVLLFHHLVKRVHDSGDVLLFVNDQQEGIVACDTADNVREVDRVDGFTCSAGASGKRVDDDQVACGGDPGDGLTEDLDEPLAYEPVAPVLGILVFPVARQCFDQLQLFDIARDGRLGHIVAGVFEQLAELFLCLDVILGNEF